MVNFKVFLLTLLSTVLLINALPGGKKNDPTPVPSTDDSIILAPLPWPFKKLLTFEIDAPAIVLPILKPITSGTAKSDPISDTPLNLDFPTAVKVNLQQPLFSTIQPMVNDIFATYLKNLTISNLPDVKVHVAVVGDRLFKVSNFKVLELDLDQKQTHINIEDGFVSINIDDFHLKISTDYAVTKVNGEVSFSGSSTIETTISVIGKLVLHQTTNGQMGFFLNDLQVPFHKLKINVSNNILNWILNLVNSIFNSLTRFILSHFVEDIVEDDIIPGFEDLINKQINLGSTSQFRTVSIGFPTISKTDGINIALGLEVKN
ncbi:hypothetical protein HK099_007889 [Clydaea vesicula]|uniref:Uncharacterized protein n=1 Tax=Clydaea vesicula TaxID=447962 RepID=A0AAD5TWN2_9FUNG|nr:hypothetical protein HK099_007889 [Clydaea vesicula]KAJ3384468.1 hypothetical protein HDU92_003578 [Lobulomyces angularis]